MCVTLTNGDSSEPSGTSDEYPSGHVDGLGSGVSPDPFILKTVSLTKSNVTRCLISSLLASELPVTFFPWLFLLISGIKFAHCIPSPSLPFLLFQSQTRSRPNRRAITFLFLLLLLLLLPSPLSPIHLLPLLSSSISIWLIPRTSPPHFSSIIWLGETDFISRKNIGLAK